MPITYDDTEVEHDAAARPSYDPQEIEVADARAAPTPGLVGSAQAMGDPTRGKMDRAKAFVGFLRSIGDVSAASPPHDQGFAHDVASSLGRGMSQAAARQAGMVEMGADIVAAASPFEGLTRAMRGVSDVAAGMRHIHEAGGQGAYGVTPEDEQSLPRRIATAVAGSLPDFAAQIATGALTGGVGSVAYAGASSASGQYTQAQDYYESLGIPRDQATFSAGIEATAAGIVTAVTSIPGMTTIFRANPKLADGLWQAARNRVWKSIEAGAEEGLQEVIEQVSQDFAEQYARSMGVDPQEGAGDIILQNLTDPKKLKELFIAGFVGFAMGSGAATVMHGGEHAEPATPADALARTLDQGHLGDPTEEEIRDYQTANQGTKIVSRTVADPREDVAAWVDAHPADAAFIAGLDHPPTRKDMQEAVPGVRANAAERAEIQQQIREHLVSPSEVETAEPEVTPSPRVEPPVADVPAEAPPSDGEVEDSGPEPPSVARPPTKSQDIPDEGAVGDAGPEEDELGRLVNRFRAEGGRTYKNINEVRAVAEKELGRRLAGPDLKIVEEAMEAAIVRDHGAAVSRAIESPDTALEEYRVEVAKYEKQPLLAQRTTDSMRRQAYSTPRPLAFIAKMLAGDKADVVIDPTAGTGMLLAGMGGAQIANEIDPTRARLMGHTLRGTATINTNDALDEGFTDDLRSLLDQTSATVIANPPFGKLGDRTFTVEDDSFARPLHTSQVDHVIALRTLQALGPDDRAVLIVASVKPKDGGLREEAYRTHNNMRAFMERLYGGWKVEKHFTVSGDLYKRQGAGWPVDVIVVSGRGSTSMGEGISPPFYDSWKSLEDLVTRKESNERPTVARPDAEPRTEGDAGRPAAEADADAPDAGDVPVAPGGKVGRRGEGGGVRGGGRPQRAEPRGAGNVAGPDVRADEGGAGDGQPASGGDPAAGDNPVPPALVPGLGDQPGTGLADVRNDAGATGADGAAERLRTGSDPDAVAARDLIKRLLELHDPNRSGKLHMNIDPEVFGIVGQLGYRLIRLGARKFSDFVKVLAGQIGELAVHYARAAYNAARAFPGIDATGMDDATWVEQRTPEEIRQMAGLAPEKAPEPDAAPRPEINPENPHQVPYRSVASGEDSGMLVPTNLLDAVTEAQKRLLQSVGDVRRFVFEEMGWTHSETDRRLSPEQLEAVALAILAHRGQREGIVVGDQTGAGKGRVAATMLAWAWRNGMLPVFTTVSPKPYQDIARDLAAIGVTDVDFIPTNTDLRGSEALELPDGRKIASVGRGTSDEIEGRIQHAIASIGEGRLQVVLTTFSQLHFTPVRGRNASPHWADKATVSPRQLFMRSIAEHAYWVMDEAHKASGTAERGRGAKDSGMKLGAFMREIAKQSKGVLYMSATWAKRPDNVPVYFRTGLGRALGDVKLLVTAMQRGGIAAQQLATDMLARAGQYVRREQSYQGINFDTKQVEGDKRVAEDFASAMRSSRLFSATLVDLIKNGRIQIPGSMMATSNTGETSITATAFSSTVHNVIAQFLLASKARDVAKQAIDLVRAGKSVVIGFHNTMEAHLADQVGHDVAGFNRVLLNALHGSMRVTVKDGSHVESVQITPDMLPPALRKMYDYTVALIDAIDFGDTRISFIDTVGELLDKAGVTNSEITGRSTRVVGDRVVTRQASEKTPAKKGRVIRQFNDGESQVMFVNTAGAEAISLHDSPETGTARRPRHMLLVQAPPDINSTMQLLGRIHRKGQVSTPAYSLIFSDLPIESRPASVLMKKLASLNANVTSARSGKVSFDVPDVMNVVGDEALHDMLVDDPGLVADLFGKDDIPPIDDEDPGRLVARTTGFAAYLPYERQKEFWEDLDRRYTEKLEEYRQAGKSPLEAAVADIQAETVVTANYAPPRSDDPIFGQGIVVERVQGRPLMRPMSRIEIMKEITDGLGLDESTSLPTREIDAQAAERIAASKKRVDEQVASIDGYNRDAEWKRKAIEKLQSQGRHVATMLGRFRPGYAVDISETTKDGSARIARGIITRVLVNAKDAHRPSAYRFRVAASRGSRTFTIGGSAMSKLMDTGEKPEGLIFLDFGSVAGHSAFDQRAQQMESMATTSKVTMHLFTGNVLAAIADDNIAERGAVVRFTRRNGSMEYGVLVDESVDMAPLLDRRTVAVSGADTLARYLALPSTQQGPRTARSSGFEVVVSQPKPGVYSIAVNAGMRQLILSPEMNATLRDKQFTGRGAVFHGTIDGTENLARAFSVLSDMGVQLITDGSSAAAAIEGYASIDLDAKKPPDSTAEECP